LLKFNIENKKKQIKKYWAKKTEKVKKHKKTARKTQTVSRSFLI